MSSYKSKGRNGGKQKAWRLGAFVARHSMRSLAGGGQPGMLGKPTLAVMGQALRHSPMALVLQMDSCEWWAHHGDEMAALGRRAQMGLA